MKLIVAVDKNWGIGKNGSLLFSIPEDMKFFRATTANKTVVMGRRTLESLPGGKPLKNRTNIVLTSDPSFSAEGVIVCHSIEMLFELLKEYHTDDVFVIGGAVVYHELLKYCDTAYVTKVDNVADADTFITDIDSQNEWKLTEQTDKKVYNGLNYQFVTYRK